MVNAAGCGSAMKEYAMLLAGDPGYEDAGAWLASHTLDFSELLASVEPRAERHPVNMRVAYHDACHLAHAQGIRAQPRALLQAVPGCSCARSRTSSAVARPGFTTSCNLMQPGSSATARRPPSSPPAQRLW